MKIYIDLFFLAVVAVYIVDVSGFTGSWRSAVARALGVKEHSLRPLPPFDCGTCMTWWACVVYSACSGMFSHATVAFSALMACLAPVIAQLLVLVRELLLYLVDIVMKMIER